MERYYYKTNEKCVYLEKDSDIGSPNCMECEFFSGVDLMEDWVKCDIYSSFAENTILKEENAILQQRINELEGCVSDLQGREV